MAMGERQPSREEANLPPPWSPAAPDFARFAPLVSTRRLDLIVLPTEQCNFRCRYCYEDFAIGRMKPALVDGLKRLIRRRAPTLDWLHVNWFGGEPLLARDVVCDVTALARDESRVNGVAFSSGASTNAYFLTPDVAAELVDAGVTDFQVTLDGPPAVHDTRRLLASGRGTFERIWSNLVAIRRSDVDLRIKLRVHFDAASVPWLRDFVQGLRTELLADPRFDVHFKALERLGGENDELIELLDFERGRALKHELAEVAGTTTAAPTASRVPDDEAVCYAARPNALVVRADGRLAKCTVALSDDRNDVGRLRADGTIELDPVKLAPWLRGLGSLDPAALGCPLAGMPAAGSGEVKDTAGIPLPLAASGR
jgi:uncharacterized protein